MKRSEIRDVSTSAVLDFASLHPGYELPAGPYTCDDLVHELDLWAKAGRCVELWWRDDDTTGPSVSLARLLDLTEPCGLALAVVPAAAVEELADAVDGRANVAVLQHGFGHRNHARPGLPAIECGGDRPIEQTLDELEAGFRRLRTLFGSRFAPILAPPWNRIEPEVVACLPQAGYRGLSTFGPRSSRAPAPGLVAVNAHFDPLSWRGGARFSGRGKALSGLIGELAARRSGAVDPREPLGLLTHHRDNDEDAWDFLERLVSVTIAHPAVRWIATAEAFAAHRSQSGTARDSRT